MSDWSLLERVRRYARVFVPDDVAEDISLLVWQVMLSRYPDRLDCFPLAARICKTKAIDWLRSANRTTSLDPSVMDTVADQGNDFEAFELWETLKKELPE